VLPSAVGHSSACSSPCLRGGGRRGVSLGNVQVGRTPPPSFAIGSFLAVATHPSPASRGGRHASPGFTLVELSIVLVIIGLILGGVVVGKSLIRAAEIRSVIADVETYFAGSRMFIDKYQCLPGDCPNATQFLIGVTNGNGNGQLSQPAVAGGPGENFGIWQQLALSGYIEGQYTGSPAAGTLGTRTVDNTPSSPVNGGDWFWYYYDNYTNHGVFYDGFMRNVLWFTPLNPTPAERAKGILSPAEAYQVDEKLDDGIPGTGFVRATHAVWTPNCTIGGSGPGAGSSYNFAYTNDSSCRLIFIAEW
jgi:prepilin-type N-terminal cleavage/methylation domain-containing protein